MNFGSCLIIKMINFCYKNYEKEGEIILVAVAVYVCEEGYIILNIEVGIDKLLNWLIFIFFPMV